ncbi:unnamed protein product [Trichobilharzia szidati]|nr:unnamed protein product [Trichobilharzia szidati]
MTTALGIILDVGFHMTPIIDEAVKCVRLLLEKKFFAESKDQVAFILCGSDATDNALADDEGNFQNISVIFSLNPISWSLLELLTPNLLSSSTADVVDAIMVAADHLHNHCKNKKGLKEKHILLVSNLCGPVDECDISKLTETLQPTGIKFSLIGCDLKNANNITPHDTLNEPGPSHRPSHQIDHPRKSIPCLPFFSDLWCRLDGDSYELIDAVSALGIFETRSVCQRGWKVEFQISDSVVIPVVGYTQIKEAHPPTMKILYAPDPSIPLHTATKYYKQNESSSEVDSSMVTRGYRYGGTLVPFGEEDMAALKPPSEKNLSVIGFTDAKNVPHYLYTGESVMVFVAEAVQQVEDSEVSPPSSSTALAALAQALYEVGGVALIRRVYSRTSAPRLGVLTPVVQDNRVSLVYTDLAFNEDIRNLELPSLPVSCESSSSTSKDFTKSQESRKSQRDCPSEEQLSAMDSFINSMMLNYADDSEDDETDDKEKEDFNNSSSNISFAPQRIPNPWIQRFFTCLRQRGLNPTMPLPTSTNHSQHWLSPEMFPGLEEIITRISSDSGDPFVSESRSMLLTSFPSLRSASESVDLTEEYLAKRRRLMEEELYGTSPSTKDADNEQPSPNSELTNGTSQNTTTSSSIQINSVQDFEVLLSKGQTELACRLMEEHIIQLVTDPFTANMLRPKAIACLYAYRKHAQRNKKIISNNNEKDNSVDIISSETDDNCTNHLEIARAYNNFIREWRQDLINRNLLGSDLSSSSAPVDNKLSFWLETITQGFGLLCEEEVPGIDVSQSENMAFLNLDDVVSYPQAAEIKSAASLSPNHVLRVDHLLNDDFE